MSGRELTMRLARMTDAQVIAAMSRELVESGLGWSWGPERVARGIRDPDTAVLIAAQGRRTVGFAIMHFGDEHAHLNLLAVLPSHQRQGIGRRMVDWLIDSARVAGIASVSLELRANNIAARHFYQALGFSEAGRIEGYYRGREAAQRMVRALRRTDAALPRWSMPYRG